MDKLKVVLLWYLGIFGATPAPDGWQTYSGGGLAFHLPPHWEEVQVDEASNAGRIAGFRPIRRFAPSDPGPADTSVTLGVGPVGKVRMTDEEELYALQTGLAAEYAAGLEESEPGTSASPVTAVYDGARHRLWFRVEAHRQGGPSSTFVVVLFFTRPDALYLQATFPLGDERFETTFQEIVSSFEMEEALHPRHPAGRLGTNPISSFRLSFELGKDFGSRHPILFFVFFLLPLALLTLAFLLDPLLFRRRLKTALIRRLQRLPARWREREARRSRRRSWLVPLPVTLACQVVLAFLVAFWLAPRFLASPQVYGFRIFASCYFLGGGLLAGALALHYLPRTSRLLKYELFAAGLSVLAVPGTLADPVLQAFVVGVDLPTLQGTYFGNYLSQTIYLVLSGLVVGWLVRSRREAAERRVATLYRVTYRLKQHVLTLIALFSWFPVGGFLSSSFAFLVVVFLVGERARERPLLYLRSFHDRDADRVLAKIIMPAAGRFWPVLAVAHALQPPEALHRKTNVLTATPLTVLPDSGWRQWVEGVLPHCRGVLIDVSVASGGVLWELERARALLAPERIAVLAQDEADLAALPGIPVVRYRLGWRGQRAARKALRSWLKELPLPSGPAERSGGVDAGPPDGELSEPIRSLLPSPGL